MNVREDSIHPKSQIVFAASANHLVGPCQHVGRIVRPICFAVLRLMKNSNLVGCSTGKSAGFAPFRILSTTKLFVDRCDICRGCTRVELRQTARQNSPMQAVFLNSKGIDLFIGFGEKSATDYKESIGVFLGNGTRYFFSLRLI